MQKIISYLVPAACLSLMSLGISGCLVGSSDPLLNPAPVNMEGQWVDANGIASSFNNGVFETRSADTNEKLAEGNYILRSDNRVELEIRSFVRGTVSRVNCSFVQSSRLLCTAQDGSRFELTRTT